jgi:hypothetical protein
MDRPGNLPGGQISEVMNIHSRKVYIVSTAPELGQDYWSTVVIPIIVRKRLFGLVKKNIPDLHHKFASFIRNSIKEAHQVHAEVRHIVTSVAETEWFDNFPSPIPPEGYSEDARRKLRDHLGYEP